MEPVSTMILVASMFAGAASTRVQFFSNESSSTPQTSLLEPISTAHRIVPTETKIAVTSNPKEALYEQLATFLPGHKAARSAITSKMDDVLIALRFVKAIPGYLPLPVLMRNDDGEIGMYWDDGDLYIDIDIDANATLSIFSKTRSTQKRNFVDDIDITSVNSRWIEEHLFAFTKHDNTFALAA